MISTYNNTTNSEFYSYHPNIFSSYTIKVYWNIVVKAPHSGPGILTTSMIWMTSIYIYSKIKNKYNRCSFLKYKSNIPLFLKSNSGALTKI